MFPADPHAPPYTPLKYPYMPRRCQHMCPAEVGEGCRGGDGECLRDEPTPLPAPRQRT